MSDKPMLLKVALRLTTIFFVHLYSILSYSLSFIIAADNLCVHMLIFLTPPYVFSKSDLKSVQSGSIVTVNWRS